MFGFATKMGELQPGTKQEVPDIIVLTETKFTPEGGGGVALWRKDGCSFVWNDVIYTVGHESVWITIRRIGDKKIAI